MFTQEDVRALAEYLGESHLLTSLYFHNPRIQTLSRRKEQIALKDLFREARRRWDNRRLTREQAASLEQDSDRIIQRLESQAAAVGRHDQAVFACSGRGFFKTLPLPGAIETGVVIGEQFWVRPLVNLLDAYPRHCVVLVDRENARIFLLKMGEIEDRASIRDDVPSQTRESGWGGYLERRIERHNDQEVHRHHQHAIEELVNFHRRHRFDRLLIGGHKESTPEFESMLPEELRRRVVGRFVIDVQLATPEEVRKRAHDAVRDYDRSEKQRLVRQALDNAGPLGRAVVGLGATLNALLKREVQILLIGDGCCAGGKRCANCGYLGGVTPADCPQCGNHLQPVDDIVEEAIRRAVLSDSQVRFINDHAEFQLAGNVGALLRYRSEQKAS